jgi:hypothetical protein
MVKGFLFYRVDISGNKLSIGMGIENPSSILPDVADAKFPAGDEAMVAAQEAGNLVICFRSFIKHRFLKHGSSLSYS